VNPVIVARGIGKQFRRQRADRPHTLQESLLRAWWRRSRPETFWAVRNVDLRVAPGEAVGIVGANGAGKSTLLRLLGGVGQIDEGALKVTGRVGALLDLSAGFHGDLTGRENAEVAAVVAGISRNEARRRLESIVAFAELADFIDNPYRTYSSGMKMRLGFSVATHASPEILLVDEVLAVGDHDFQLKCFEKIAELRRGGCTIVMASHDELTLKRWCDRAIWMSAGRITGEGSVEEAMRQYFSAPTPETLRRTPEQEESAPPGEPAAAVPLELHRNRFGSQELRITCVRFLDSEGRATTVIAGGSSLRVEMDYDAGTGVRAPIFTVALASDEGVVCYETSTSGEGLTLPDLSGVGRIALVFERLDLAQGEYWIDLRVLAPEWEYAYDHHTDVYRFVVQAPELGSGLFHPPHAWDLTEVPELALLPRMVGK
jgi:lipopolysaccharide transport system ATP-binding protein